ncbi:hypothetical protein A2U01_0058125, partial [Trifolium medium]|nr:hypothetical protein [Trifolium medium]
LNTHQKCPALERLQQPPKQNKKRDCTPPREDRSPQRQRRGNRLYDPSSGVSPPQGLKLMPKQGASSSQAYHGSRGNRSHMPPRHNNSHPRSPVWSDEDSPRGPLSRDIMRVPLPSGLVKPPQLGTCDGLT